MESQIWKILSYLFAMSLNTIPDNSLVKGSIFRRVNNSAEIDPTKYVPFDHIIADVQTKSLQKYPFISTGLYIVKSLLLVCIQDKNHNKCQSTCTFRVRAKYISENSKLSC